MSRVLSDEERVAASKRALYHHERGRVFRPTRSEFDSGNYTCPYCRGTPLKKVRYRANDHALSCPRCHWTIHRDDIWSPVPDAEPEIREPGDATGDMFEEGAPPEGIEMSLEEVVLPEPPVIDMSLEEALEEPPPVIVVG